MLPVITERFHTECRRIYEFSPLQGQFPRVEIKCNIIETFRAKNCTKIISDNDLRAYVGYISIANNIVSEMDYKRKDSQKFQKFARLAIGGERENRDRSIIDRTIYD